MKLTIVILNWNVSELLAGCLRSLPAACGLWSASTEVIVVDNASTDDSIEMVRREFPWARLIVLKDNIGFSAGNNAGLQAARGEHILFLNPDTVAHQLSIAILSDYLDNHPTVGIAGPRLLNADGTTQSSRRRFPNLATALIESTPLQRLHPNGKMLNSFYVQDRTDYEEQYVDWLSGAALMCRREAVQQAGPFDPGYFMFSEEVDLCKRIANAGWQVAYVPQAEIAHYGGGSTDQAIPERHINFNTGKARYLRLHEGHVMSRLVRLYLLGTYAAQTVSEAAKWALGNKRTMRKQRIVTYAQVLKSGLREHAPRGNKKQSVLLITGEYPPAQGGVGDYTCKLAKALDRAEVGNRVLTQQHEVGETRSAKGGKQKPGAYRVPRITLRAVLLALKGTKADIAHIQYQTGAYGMQPTVNLLPALLRLSWGKPTVVTFHDLLVPYLFPKAGPVREWANRLLARTASVAIATNHADASRLRGWGVESVKVIPIGSNIPNRPPLDFSRESWRAGRGIAQDTTLLAYFGFLNSTKGLDDLLCALQALNEQAPGKYRLMMVGGGLGSSDPTNQATAQALEQLATELGVRDDLLWTGYLNPEEVSAALLSADVAVLPYTDGASFRRGSLLAVLEHGLPVITTQPTIGQVEDVESQKPWPRLINEENALLVRSGDTAALVQATKRISADAALRSKLANGAKELAKYFSWDSIARAHVELYRRLTKE